ncbi:hypothetical protein MUP06_02175, partial [Patescibacteria group bacterium]|nr:hypothetical protein [Patescibacteria group bacterium]
MRILAVETSCDDTCVAVLKIKDLRFKILSNIVSSQVKIHAKYGGVYPSLAKREHQRNLPIVLRKALRTAKNPKVDPVVKFGKSSAPLVSLSAKHSKFYYGVDLIAVTVGPGLEPCLWVG